MTRLVAQPRRGTTFTSNGGSLVEARRTGTGLVRRICCYGPPSSSSNWNRDEERPDRAQPGAPRSTARKTARRSQRGAPSSSATRSVQTTATRSAQSDRDEEIDRDGERRERARRGMTRASAARQRRARTRRGAPRRTRRGARRRPQRGAQRPRRGAQSTARRSAQFDRGEERPERPRGGAPRRPQRGAESSATRSAELERDEERPERPRGGASRATATRSVESERGEQRRERARRAAPGPRRAPSRARRGAPTRPRGGAPSSTREEPKSIATRRPPCNRMEARDPRFLAVAAQVCRLERSAGPSPPHRAFSSRRGVLARAALAVCSRLGIRRFRSGWRSKCTFAEGDGNEEPGERRSGRSPKNGELLIAA